MRRAYVSCVRCASLKEHSAAQGARPAVIMAAQRHYSGRKKVSRLLPWRMALVCLSLPARSGSFT